jgi:hypothetical protein
MTQRKRLALATSQEPIDLVDEILRLDRLGDVAVEAGGQHALAIADHREGRDGDHRHA